jgi:extradiol dioxygenase family protein
MMMAATLSRRGFIGLSALAVARSRAAFVQLSEPNGAGVAMGHLHYVVQDVGAHLEFWGRLGGAPDRIGDTAGVRFPDVLVFLSEGEAAGGTEGSVVNHVAFRVTSLGEIARRGFDVELLVDYPGVGSVRTPEGERIELFDETATNLTFTPDSGPADPVAERHNRPLTVPIIAHHVHLHVPEVDVVRARDWYADTFGGTPGVRWRYPAVDFPGINLNFSAAPEPAVPPAPTRGRMLDHIGFEVRNLERFSESLEVRGIVFDTLDRPRLSGLAATALTDPWGTTIELTEGLAGW